MDWSNSVMSTRDQLLPIDKYGGPSKDELLNFILDHMLGIDELLLPGFKPWDQRKRNIASIEEGGYEGALFHRLADAMGERHYLVPSGSNFEGLSLPHLNFEEIKNESSRSDDSLEEANAWVSDIDFMYVLTDIEVFDSLAQCKQRYHEAWGQTKDDVTWTTEKAPLEAANVKTSFMTMHDHMDEMGVQQGNVQDNEVLVAENNTDASVMDSKPSVEENGETRCLAQAADAPGYVTLRCLNKESTTLQRALHVHDNTQYFSSFKFNQEMNQRALKFCNISAIEEINSITVHGPAFQFTKLPPGDEQVSNEAHNFLNKSVPGVDIVWSLEFRSWPSQGRAWVKRNRLWPSQEIIDDIVLSGCHLVPVASKQSSFPELEWRLSFSKAEKKLAKLLTNVQRKVYLITKALHYTHLKAFGVLSTYLLKTALFWHCEKEYSRLWQQGEIGSCFLSYVKLLISYLEKRNWPHYFIPENNLIGHLEADNLQGLLAALKINHTNPLKVLQECQNKLVSHFYDEGANSFDVAFAPILSELKSQDVKISAKAFHNTLWETGNFYLFSQGLEQALHFYKLATVYLKGMDRDTQIDVLQSVKEYAITCGDLEEAIRCSEELVSLIMSSNDNRPLAVASDIAMVGNWSQEVSGSSLETGSDELSKVQNSTTSIRSKPTKFWLVNLAGQENQSNNKNVCIERARGEQGGKQVDSYMGSSQQTESKKEEGECECDYRCIIDTDFQVSAKEEEDICQVEAHNEPGEEPVESEMGCLLQAAAEGKEGEYETKISDAEREINERMTGHRPEETEYDRGKGQIGSKIGHFQQAAAVEEEATSEHEFPSNDSDTKNSDIETEETRIGGASDAALGDLGWLYQIRAMQKSTEDEERLWLLRAETCFKEALRCGSSLAPIVQYGNLLLREQRPKDGARVLTIGVENDEMMEQRSYVFFDNIEYCILDTGVTDILAKEGNLAFPTALYCLYLLLKAYLALIDGKNTMKYLKKLEMRSYDVNDDEIGKQGALCLLKQGFLACGLQLEANEVQTRIDILMNDENDSETSDNEGEAEKIKDMVDLSECNDLVRFHVGNYELPCLCFED